MDNSNVRKVVLFTFTSALVITFKLKVNTVTHLTVNDVTVDITLG